MEQGSQEAAGYRWTFSHAEFDEVRWELRVAGEPVELERKPLEVLAQLLRHAGEVLTKEELLESVWTGRIVVEAALTNAIGKLRRALGDEAQGIIVTVPRIGYRLEGRVARKAVPALVPDSVLAVGDAVPRRPNYRLVERLARNEDSEVWRAEQPKSHEIRVFKFSLNGSRLPGLKREVTLTRLLRDALGNRPEFVRVLDWDFEQVPYFIESEFGGTSLDAWFDQHGVSADRAARLQLIADAADAVASAHEVGVLHKDLKPANLLVYGESGNWHPRLTDFGSGRLLDAARLEALGITQLGLTRTQSLMSDSQSGTLLYLAPEIIAGRAPTIKSDLYALGVMLYQMLVGDFRRPLSPGWEADVDDPLLRRDIADFANGDPEKRPSSARELAERLRTLDLRRTRHDLDLAIQARIESNERKLALTQARRPWIAAAMVVLAAGVGFSLFYAHRAENASREAAASSAVAQQATTKAERNLKRVNGVIAFLIEDVIGAADPFRAGSELSIQQALHRAEESIGTRFKDEPETEAHVRIMLAQAYSGRGEHLLASGQYARAVAVVEAAPSADQSIALQARLHQAGSLLNMGDMSGFDRVMAPVQKAVEVDQTLDPRLRLHAYFVSGQKSMLVGDIQPAVAYLEKADAIVQAMDSPDPSTALRVKSILGVMYGRAGQHAKAVAIMRDASARAIRQYGAVHPEALNTRILLGIALNGQKSYHEAAQELEALKRDAIVTHGIDSEQVLDTDQLLAKALVGKGKLSDGLDLFEAAYARRLARSGASNPLTLELAASFADALRLAGRSGTALEVLDEAQAAAAKLADNAGAPLLQKLRFIQACVLASNGDGAGALAIAASLDAEILTAADPPGQWPWRLGQLRRSATLAGTDERAADPCPEVSAIDAGTSAD
ncbi:MAG: Serine/threonine-protein kinase PrkC [Dehalococcoidia bacterium]|nr:Serine/threonine-protein kinase PrkC [Chloroflexota bacterium]